MLFQSGNQLPLLMFYKNEMVTLKYLILQYIGWKKNQYIYIEKCQVGINVVF